MNQSLKQGWDSSYSNVDVCNVNVFSLELVEEMKGRKNFSGRTQSEVYAYFRCYRSSVNSHLWDWSFLINSSYLPEVSFMEHAFIASLFLTAGDTETNPRFLSE